MTSIIEHPRDICKCGSLNGVQMITFSNGICNDCHRWKA